MKPPAAKVLPVTVTSPVFLLYGTGATESAPELAGSVGSELRSMEIGAMQSIFQKACWTRSCQSTCRFALPVAGFSVPVAGPVAVGVMSMTLACLENT